MELVKNISAVIGVILSCLTLISALSERARKFILSVLQSSENKKKPDAAESDKDMTEIKNALIKLQERFDNNNQSASDHAINHSNDLAEVKNAMNELNHRLDILEISARQQCRNLITSKYYEYVGAKTIRLYDRQIIMETYALYKNELEGNSYTTELYAEIMSWPVIPN